MKKTIAFAAMLMICILAVVFAQDRNTGTPRGRTGNQGQAAVEDSGGQMTGPGPMMGRGPMMGGRCQGAGKIEQYIRRAEELKLSDDQVKKLKDLRATFLKNMINDRAKLATGQVELNQLLENDNPDMAAVEKMVRANHEISADIVIATIRANRAADAVLTADQLKAAKKLAPGFQQNRPQGDMRGGQGRGMMGRMGMGR